ncbi:MAG: hypothetical protein ACI909_002371 [Planctomycetota bacterium]|jgi:hypothetical protein
MPKNNLLGSEIKSWKDFVLDGKNYDLSHLDSHGIQVVDDRNSDNVRTYNIYVTYSFHCFAKDDGTLSEEDKIKLNYDAHRDSRPFNIRRYNLSKNLPDIINSLGNKETLVFHRGYENYATYKALDEDGNEVDYIVSFSIFKEQKKLRLHVRTAYPEDNGIGKVKKVSIFVLAYNALHSKKMPTLLP